MQVAGFTEANGFTHEQLLVYRDAMRNVVREETRRIVDAGRRLGPEQASVLVEEGMDAIDELVRFFHLRAIREAIDAWRELTGVDEEAELVTRSAPAAKRRVRAAGTSAPSP
jgi:hypothetical protein